MKRKLLALALSVAMVFSLVPATSLQAEEIAAKPQAEQLADAQDAADDLALTAAVSSDYTSSWEKLEGINTEWEPTVSNGGTQKGWGNWQQEAGSEHWVQYDWEDAVTTQQMQVYWYDDGGDTRVPATLKIQYRNADSEAWTDATMVTDYADAQELNAYYGEIYPPSDDRSRGRGGNGYLSLEGNARTGTGNCAQRRGD